VLIALTADHGVAELPEYLTAEGRNHCPEQGRISAEWLLASIYWNVYKAFTFPFHRPDKLVVFGGAGFSVNTHVAKELGLDPEEVILWLDEYLGSLPIFETTWTQAEIQSSTTDVGRLMRNSLVPGRSSDVLIQMAKDCVIRPDGGTTHGSVYDYDRDVPLAFYGWGVSPGKISGAAFSVDMGPTIAHHLGVAMPADLDGKVLNLSANQVVDPDH
jgi:hypothetical protein